VGFFVFLFFIILKWLSSLFIHQLTCSFFQQKCLKTDEYLEPLTHRNSNLFSAAAITTAFIIKNTPDLG